MRRTFVLHACGRLERRRIAPVLPQRGKELGDRGNAAPAPNAESFRRFGGRTPPPYELNPMTRSPERMSAIPAHWFPTNCSLNTTIPSEIGING